MGDYSKEIITLRLDKHYFGRHTGIRPDHREEDEKLWRKLHPRAKYLPMEYLGKARDGMLSTWNIFLNVPSRQVQNSRREQFEDYVRYCIERQNIPRAYIEKCIVLVVQFKPRATKSDSDGICAKSTLDCLVREEVLAEDNYKNMVLYMATSVVDKNDPRSEIRIYPIYKEDGYTYDFVLDYIANELKELNSEYKIV